jgi:hypothetical protein
MLGERAEIDERTDQPAIAAFYGRRIECADEALLRIADRLAVVLEKVLLRHVRGTPSAL